MKKLVGLAAVVAVLLSGCSSEEDAAPANETATEIPAETQEAEPSSEDTALAKEVEKAVIDGNAVDSFQELNSTSPGFYISRMEDVSTGTVRVYVQAELSDAEREDTAKWVKNMSGMDELTTVVIRDTTGVDSNHYYM